MRKVILNGRFGFRSALRFLVITTTLVSHHACAKQISDQFLDILTGGGEPDPMVTHLPSTEPDDSIRRTESGEMELYDNDLRLTHEALVEHGYQVVKLSASMQNAQLSVDLYNPRISGLDRSVGRAARILDLYAPQTLQTLLICYMERAVIATVCYQIDRAGLNLYFERLISRWQLRNYIKRSEHRVAESATLVSERDASPPPVVVDSSDARAYFSEVEQGLFNGYSLYQSNRLGLVAQPIEIGRYLNDQHGDLFIDVKSALTLDAYLGGGWSINSSVFYRWFSPSGAETSDSLLPKVRSNIDLYRASKEAKIDRLYVSYSTKLTQNSYFNANLGYQEEMFGGLSTQLYLPNVREFLDIELRGDWVRQRDIDDPQSFEDYDVVSALLGMRFRWKGLPNDIKFYVGRFLAKDDGIRLDIGHRFSNGVRLAFWYSYTDKKDETGPGSPGDPYRNHGISLALPLNAVNKRRDSRRVYDLGYMPHVRDTAQMLHWPVDLSENYWLRPGFGNQLQQFGQ